MRAFLVVLVAKPIELALLRGEGRARRPDGFAFQRLVHPLVRAVLLRMGGEDALVLNA